MDGTALCRIAEGVVQECTTLTNDLVAISSLDGSWETGMGIVLIPFMMGYLVGAIADMIKSTGRG